MAVLCPAHTADWGGAFLGTIPHSLFGDLLCLVCVCKLWSAIPFETPLQDQQRGKNLNFSPRRSNFKQEGWEQELLYGIPQPNQAFADQSQTPWEKLVFNNLSQEQTSCLSITLCFPACTLAALQVSTRSKRCMRTAKKITSHRTSGSSRSLQDRLQQDSGALFLIPKKLHLSHQ